MDCPVFGGKFRIGEEDFLHRWGSELRELGLIKMDIGGGAWITPAGSAVVEVTSPIYQHLRGADVKNITINAPVSGSNIVQGDSNVLINVSIDFLEKLKKAIDQSELPDDEKRTWLERLKEWAAHPLLVQLLAQVLAGT
jgi:hypothetical protein